MIVSEDVENYTTYLSEESTDEEIEEMLTSLEEVDLAARKAVEIPLEEERYETASYIAKKLDQEFDLGLGYEEVK